MLTTVRPVVNILTVTIADFLQQEVPFLWGLSDADANSLAEAVVQTSFTLGQVIIRQGMTVEGLHVIAEGKVGVWIKSHGKTAAQAAVLGPGALFGATSIIESGVADATMKAAEQCLIYRIPQENFLKILETYPELKDFFVRRIAERRKKQAAPKRQ